MGRFWKAFVDDLKRQGEYYGFTKPKPPANTGDGYDTTRPEYWEEWQARYEKFRRRMGRDPYSFRELKDWWEQL